MSFIKGIPSGVVLPYAGTTSPIGWLLCYGQTVSRTTYADLFAAISTTYGAGDGLTTFALPDFRGRIAAGKDDMGGSTASRLTAAGSGITGTTLGDAGGAETHTLATTQLASHAHTMGNHTHGGTTATHSASHSHSSTHNHYQDAQIYAVAQGTDPAGRVWSAGNTAPTSSDSANISTADTSHAHTYTSGAPSTNTSDATGGALAHQNTQPTIIMNKIIKI